MDREGNHTLKLKITHNEAHLFHGMLTSVVIAWCHKHNSPVYILYTTGKLAYTYS
jgi:hypothetical protein